MIVVGIGDRTERIVAAVSTGTTALIYLIGLLFSFHYSYYIQATFPDRRMFEYGSIFVAILIAAGVTALFRRVARSDDRVFTGLATVLAVTIVAASGWSGLVGGVARGRPHNGYIEAARVATPCNSRLLTPMMTRGSFQSLTGRASLREGLMAFLRPDLLAHALTIEREGGQFYRSPGAHGDFLVRDHVDYVLAPTAMEGRLSQLTTLQRTAVVDGVAVYRVASAFEAGAPRPADARGYVCRSGALE
jgi:energy-converting hydrogenase Eha subunit A